MIARLARGVRAAAAVCGLTVLAAGCASAPTSAGTVPVPRPFPVPGGTAPAGAPEVAPVPPHPPNTFDQVLPGRPGARLPGHALHVRRFGSRNRIRLQRVHAVHLRPVRHRSPAQRDGTVQGGRSRQDPERPPRGSPLLHDRRTRRLARGDCNRRRRVRPRAELDRRRARGAPRLVLLVAPVRRGPPRGGQLKPRRRYSPAAPMRERMIRWRRTSPRDGFAGFSTLGLMIAAASIAACSRSSAEAGTPK